MPYRLPHACGVPGCPIVATGKTQYCEEHKRVRTYDEDRPSAWRRGYGGKRWQRLRGVVLAKNPLCVACLERDRTEPAVDVDHILPKNEGGTDALSNLQGLCVSCHSKKTRGEMLARGRVW